jgi:5-methylcytosine-specific restriction endonuclease McrA
MMSKKCSKCNYVLPLDWFNNYSRSSDGKQRYCRPCSNGYWKGWSKTDTGKQSIANRKRTEFTQLQKEQAFNKYGNNCQLCEFTHLSRELFHVDHRIPDAICNEGMSAFDENAWVLCAGCNSSKHKHLITNVLSEWMLMGFKIDAKEILKPKYYNKLKNIQFEYRKITIGGVALRQVVWK